jgi:hypothetical protein
LRKGSAGAGLEIGFVAIVIAAERRLVEWE